MRTPPPRDDLRFSNTTGILQKKKKTICFIGVEVEQETTAPPPQKNTGSAPGHAVKSFNWTLRQIIEMHHDACIQIFLLFDIEILMSKI